MEVENDKQLNKDENVLMDFTNSFKRDIKSFKGKKGKKANAMNKTEISNMYESSIIYM